MPELGPATLRFTAAGDDKAVKLSELKLAAVDRLLALDARASCNSPNCASRPADNGVR